MDTKGVLYLVATPIGNLEDMTYRAVRILKEVDLIAAEDTRNSLKLLNHFEINTPMTSYHEFNKIEKAITLVEKLKEGQNIAVITDAGTPGISDPGEELVAMCYEENIEVFSIPGPAACITAVTQSGQKCRRFAFEAFLPREKRQRQQILADLVDETRTMIVYEAPHHLIGTLNDLYETLGDRSITICKELTKKHEKKLKTTFKEALKLYETTEPKGEYVLIIAGKTFEEIKQQEEAVFAEMSIEDHMQQYLDKGLDKKEAMKAVAKDRGVSKRDIYNYLEKQ